MLLEEASVDELLSELDNRINGHMDIDTIADCDIYTIHIACNTDLSQVNVLSEV